MTKLEVDRGIIQMHKNKMLVQEIAKALNLKPYYIYQVLRKENLKKWK